MDGAVLLLAKLAIIKKYRFGCIRKNIDAAGFFYSRARWRVELVSFVRRT
jgi:hypothetical protein